MPIRDLQRRLTEVGRIRIGQKLPTANGKSTRPAKLDRLRFTSPAQHLIDAIAEQLGGQTQPWQAPAGPQFEVITDAKEIPVYVPQQTIDPWYEAWGNGYMQRRCDGERETKRDIACMCNPDRRDCKPTTRISLMLADVPGLGVWRLESHGWNAAAELSMLTDMLAKTTQPLPARLMIQPRQQKVLKPDGKVETRDFMVPILLFDAITSRQIQGGADSIARALAGGQQAIEAGPQRQEITAGSGEAETDWLALIAGAETVADLNGLREKMQAAGVRDKAIVDAWVARSAALSPKPPPAAVPVVEEPVVAEVEPNPDETWAAILREAGKRGWNTARVEQEFRARLETDAQDANGWQLDSFLTAMRDGRVQS
jgi:hypothetical protein